MGRAGVDRDHAGRARLQGQQAWNRQFVGDVPDVVGTGQPQQLVIQLGLGRRTDQQDGSLGVALGQHLDDGCPVGLGPPLGVGGQFAAQPGAHRPPVADLHQQQRAVGPLTGLQPAFDILGHRRRDRQDRVLGGQHRLQRRLPEGRRDHRCDPLRKFHQVFVVVAKAFDTGPDHLVLMQAGPGQQGQQAFMAVAVPDRTRTLLAQLCHQCLLLGAEPVGQLAMLQQHDLADTGLPLVELAGPAPGRQDVDRRTVARRQLPDQGLDQHHVAQCAEAHHQGAGGARLLFNPARLHHKNRGTLPILPVFRSCFRMHGGARLPVAGSCRHRPAMRTQCDDSRYRASEGIGHAQCFRYPTWHGAGHRGHGTQGMQARRFAHDGSRAGRG